jgi:hypothetical protein
MNPQNWTHTLTKKIKIEISSQDFLSLLHIIYYKENNNGELFPSSNCDVFCN